MKWILGLLFIYSHIASVAQGTLLNEGDSATFFGYSTIRINSTDFPNPPRLHSGYFGFNIDRKFEVEFSLGAIDDNRVFEVDLGAYLNLADDLGVRMSYQHSRVFGEGFNGFGATLYLGSSEIYSKFVPRAGFIRSTGGVVNYQIGADMLLGEKSGGARAGVTLITDGSDSTLFQLSLGFLFAQRKIKQSI